MYSSGTLSRDEQAADNQVQERSATGEEGASDLLRALSGYSSEASADLTLPPLAYSSPWLFGLEMKAVFADSWLLIGRSSEIEPGSYHCFTVGLDPVTLVRDREGTLRAMSPICRHRMMPVVAPGRGSVDRLRCQYHLWAYSLDGTLAGAPLMAGTEGFDRAEYSLAGFAVTEWNGFAFLNLNASASPLEPQLAELPADLIPADLSQLVQVATYQDEWVTNWKLVVENVSETYHHMGLHPSTVEPSVPSRGGIRDIASSDCWTAFRAPLSPTARGVDGRPSEAGFTSFLNLFPAAQLFTVDDAVFWASYLPLAADRTRVNAGVLLPARLAAGVDGDRRRAGYDQLLRAFNAEDRDALEAVQRSAVSRFAARGPLGAAEAAIAVFYRQLMRRLFGPDAQATGGQHD